VRAANSGISAVIDPLGRIVKLLPLGSEGVLDAPLPEPMAPTPYAQLGDGPVGAMVGIAFVWVMGSHWRSRARERRTGSTNS
jgi:apolipoprotein N-acyltransferase